MNKIPNWDLYFFNLLKPISSRSKDPNTQIGAVIVGPNNEIRSTGYNSFPRNIDDKNPERFERPEKYFWMEHAERNAIYSAARVGTPLDGCRIYIPGLSCMDCGRAIVQCGIVQVIYDYRFQYEWEKTTPKYKPDFERVKTLFQEAKINLVAVDLLTT